MPAINTELRKLARELCHGDAEQRASALENLLEEQTLTRIRTASSVIVPELLQCFRCDEDAREEAVTLLAAIGPPAYTGWLELLTDPAPGIALAATEELVAAGLLNGGYHEVGVIPITHVRDLPIEPLLRAAASPLPPVRQAALANLAFVRDRYADDAIVAAIDDRDATVRRQVIEHLSIRSRIATVRRILHRVAACSLALGLVLVLATAVGAAIGAAILGLTGLWISFWVATITVGVVVVTFATFVSAGLFFRVRDSLRPRRLPYASYPEVMNKLIERLADENREVRLAATEKLSEIGDRQLRRSIRRHRKHTSGAVRAAAAVTLAYLGDFHLLLEDLTDSDPQARADATHAVGRLYGRRLLQPTNLLSRTCTGLRRSFLRFTSQPMPPSLSDEILPRLEKMRRDQTPQVRTATLAALERIAYPTTAGWVSEALEDEESNVRVAALHAMQSFPEQVDVAKIMQCLESSEPNGAWWSGCPRY